ncbi:hypothetical protein AB4Z52_25610 [Rhizobium sp. 2YAF20]
MEITKYGRPTAYLVSSEMFHQLWQRFRGSLSQKLYRRAM